MKIARSQSASAALLTQSSPATHFRHQDYAAAAPQTPCFFVEPRRGPKFGCGEFRRRLAETGERLTAAQVGVLFFVHGSFAALDSLNILAALARRYRPARLSHHRLARQLIDSEVHDAGHYTPAYAQAWEDALRGEGRPRARWVSWSSENHHLGRADAAIRLIAELAALDLPADKRVVFCGHGHAGNVFALMSQLLSADARAVRHFFDAARIYYRWPVTPLIDIPIWRRVRHLLLDERRRIATRPCDWITFGTPIRYGWSLRENDSLLHFIYHRPRAARPAHLAAFPATTDEALCGVGGDYLQHVGIAGTDSPPSPLMWRSWLANRRLERLLEGEARGDALANRLQLGARVHDCGTTLLVDYSTPDETTARHLAGHAVYTRPEWLLFHAERMAQHLERDVATGVRAA